MHNFGIQPNDRSPRRGKENNGRTSPKRKRNVILKDH